MAEDDDLFFGGSDKLYYSEEAESMVSDLQEWGVVSEKVDAYQLGFAIGIRRQSPVEIPKGKAINFGNLYSLRHQLLVKALMFHLHPDLEAKARKDKMDEYAEGGIRLLHTHAAANHGSVDWSQFVDGRAVADSPQASAAQPPPPAPPPAPAVPGKVAKARKAPADAPR
jgi:hypothetical protein